MPIEGQSERVFFFDFQGSTLGIFLVRKFEFEYIDNVQYPVLKLCD